jgi:hypothetical protein
MMMKRGNKCYVYEFRKFCIVLWMVFGLENREYGCRDPLCWPQNTLYPQKLTPTSPTSGGRSVRIVRSRTQATEYCVCYFGDREDKCTSVANSTKCVHCNFYSSLTHPFVSGIKLSIGLWRWYINITITILDIIHCPVFHLKRIVSETEFCLRLQVEPIPLGPVDWATLCLLVRRQRVALLCVPYWFCFTWRRRQNPVSETSCFK